MGQITLGIIFMFVMASLPVLMFVQNSKKGTTFMTYSVDLVIDPEYKAYDLFKNCQRLQVAIQLIQEAGPGSSKTVYRFFSSNKSELRKLLIKFDMNQYSKDIKFAI